MASIGPSKILTLQQVESYAAAAGFSNAIVAKSAFAPGTWTQMQTIVAIAGAESGFNVNAYNPSDPFGGSYGILQINGAHFHVGGTSQAAALDPQQAFQYAYTLSNHGTNFLPWGTFTNGSYKSHIPPVTAGVSGLPQNGWWNFIHDYDYGKYPDPQGAYNKPDVNVRVPYGYPVAMPVTGTISGINSPNGIMPSFGAVVTIKLDTPINNLATHLAFLHLADVTVRLNQRVNIGDVVGHAGDSNHAAGSAPALMGVALTSDDYYGIGSGWKYNAQGDARLDPSPFIDAVKNNTPFTLSYNGVTPTGVAAGIGVVGAHEGLVSGLTAATQYVTQTVHLVPDANTVAVFDVLDIYTELVGFDQALPRDASGNPDYSNIFTVLADLLAWFTLETSIIIVRLLFIAVGIYICFRVINHVVNFTGGLANIAQTAGQAVQIGAALG